MKKKIYLLLTLLLATALSAQAQYQRWWGIYDESMPLTAVGTGVAETYHCGAYFSGGRVILSGGTVHALRFWLNDKTNISDVQVWMSVNKPPSGDKADLLVMDVPQENVKDRSHDQAMTEVTLPQPYTFEGTTGVYIGFSFRMNKAETDADKNPVLYTKSARGNNTFLIRTSKAVLSWNDLGSMSTYGALGMQLLISNPTLTNHAVAIGDAYDVTDLCGAVCNTQATIASMGFAAVDNIDYVLTVAGEELPEQHLILPKPLAAANATTTLPLSLTMPATNGVFDYRVKVTRVNGEPNEAEEMTEASARLIAIDRKAHRRSVVEEFTGTWCTNCPRGIAGMHHMEEDFDDDFIGIAVHTDPDPMVIPAYSAIVGALQGGVPTCYMDRYLQCDPYLGDILTDYHYHASTTFRQMLNRNTEADVQLSARWNDAEQTEIAYTATTTFNLDLDKSNYALAFVLTADGLRGEGKEWWQVNGDSGNNTFPDADMDFFRNASDPITDIEYNHVAIGGTNVATGISGSIASPIVSGQPQTYEGTFSIAGNKLVQDKAKLHAIVLLLNTTTGEIVNAAKVNMGEVRTGIESIQHSTPNTQHPSAIYDLQGCLVYRGYEGTSRGYDGTKVRGCEDSKEGNLAPSHPRTPAPSIKKGIYIVNGKKVIIK